MRRVLVFAVAAIATALTAGSGHASAPSRIVFAADRAPLLKGEIYRVDPSGRRVDLSRSPFEDSGPVVSPDGRRVAFVSDRGGVGSVWEVGIDGGGLVRVGPSLVIDVVGDYVVPGQSPREPELAWQPHGSNLALVATTYPDSFLRTLWIVNPDEQPRSVFAGNHVIGPGWSPDGHVLLAWAGGVARAFSAAGSPLWDVSGARSDWVVGWSWSRHGLLALPMESGLRVYDEGGHQQFVVPGSVPGKPGWSPDGKLLAAVIGGKLEMLTARGKRLLSRAVGGRRSCQDVTWASDRRVLVGGFDRSGGLHPPSCRVISVDVHTGRVSAGASSLWFGPRSADGRLAALAIQKGKRIALGVTQLAAGGAQKTYAHVPACQAGLRPTPVTSLQFVGRSLVYTSYCPNPVITVYSVAPDGSGLQQITDGTSPALSPDGTRIAYVPATKGNRGSIRIIDSSGVHVAFAGRTFCNPISPTWSPDGKTILFVRCVGPELYTVPAGGGTPHNLGLSGSEPAWGPSRIAYVNQDQSFGTGIWTANPDGSDPTQLANGGDSPAWSSDGRLAYLTGDANTTVVVGSTQTQLPFNDVLGLGWSPDGTRFVVSARTTTTAPFDIYTVNTDGSDPIRLTQNYDTFFSVSWR